jgi:hypothetical protein
MALFGKNALQNRQESAMGCQGPFRRVVARDTGVLKSKKRGDFP